MDMMEMEPLQNADKKEMSPVRAFFVYGDVISNYVGEARSVYRFNGNTLGEELEEMNRMKHIMRNYAFHDMREKDVGDQLKEFISIINTIRDRVMAQLLEGY